MSNASEHIHSFSSWRESAADEASEQLRHQEEAQREGFEQPHAGAEVVVLHPAQEVREPAQSYAAVPATVMPLATAPAADPTAGVCAAGSCVLPSGWSFNGTLDAGGDVAISGNLEGCVRLGSSLATLHLLQSGTAQGEVTGGNVKLDGTFKGSVDAAGASVDMGGSAKVEGRIVYSSIRMQGGRHKVELVHVDAAAS